jgi:transcription-repair coupling factor (superfamily II helicase)
LEVDAEVEKTARALVKLARERERAAAPRLTAAATRYRWFAARFPYSATPDQQRAIDAVLRDLASGRPMNRLVCGDVGFGKTEVALRAAAAAVFSGKQVALIAPTTVLVRQHLETFRRRFAEFGVGVQALSRASRAAANRAIMRGAADGSIGILVGTHALASDKLRFTISGSSSSTKSSGSGSGKSCCCSSRCRAARVSSSARASPIWSRCAGHRHPPRLRAGGRNSHGSLPPAGAPGE